MRKYLILLGILLCGIPAHAQQVINGNRVFVTATGNQVQCTNDGTTGTTINLLAKATTTGCIKTGTTDTNVPVWIVTSASATTGSASLAVTGQASCKMDSTIASGGEGYYVVESTTTAGDCHAQSAQPTGVFIVGSLISDSTTSGSIATVQVLSTFNPAGGTSSPTIEAFAGDGSDGAVTADGTTTLTCLGAPTATVYTLTRDCFFTTLVNNTSTTIKTANYRLLASVSITNNGTISNNGSNGGNGGNAAGATGGTAGTAGTILAAGTLPAVAIGKVGVVGATGVTTAATGAAGTAATAAQTGTNTLVATATASTVAGGAGGSSVGGANAGGAGGTGGSSGAASVVKYPARVPSRAEFMVIPAGTGYAPASTIAGSGSGGAGAGDGTNAGGGGGASGGNGSPGGLMVLISPTIVNSATGLITATGGNGGNGGNGAAGVGGNAGGGGGGSGGEAGSGGAIALVYTTLTETTVATAASGSGGSAGALGAGVGTGANGVIGNAGVASLAGTIWRISLP